MAQFDVQPQVIRRAETSAGLAFQAFDARADVIVAPDAQGRMRVDPAGRQHRPRAKGQPKPVGHCGDPQPHAPQRNDKGESRMRRPVRPARRCLCQRAQPVVQRGGKRVSPIRDRECG